MSEKKIYQHHERDSEAGALTDIQSREIVYASDIHYLIFENAAAAARYILTMSEDAISEDEGDLTTIGNLTVGDSVFIGGNVEGTQRLDINSVGSLYSDDDGTVLLKNTTGIDLQLEVVGTGDIKLKAASTEMVNIDSAKVTAKKPLVCSESLSTTQKTQTITTDNDTLLACSDTSYMYITTSLTGSPASYTVGMEAGSYGGQRLVVMCNSDASAIEIDDNVATSATIVLQNYTTLQLQGDYELAEFIWNDTTSKWYLLNTNGTLA